jgi:hypothetical protein
MCRSSGTSPAVRGTNAAALALLIIAAIIYTFYGREAGQRRVYSELADLHVTAWLAQLP